jgi:short-subunit dehydrogenase
MVTARVGAGRECARQLQRFGEGMSHCRRRCGHLTTPARLRARGIRLASSAGYAGGEILLRVVASMTRTGRLAWLASGVAGALAVRAGLRRARSMDLTGARVLITGGSRGLGLTLAREFGRQGARVAVCARDTEDLARARADLETRSIQATTIPCDLTDRGQVERMIAQALGDLGQIDVLVNNAGVVEVGPFDSMTLADFETAMAVNFWAAVYTTLAVVPHMRKQGGGRIVNIASIGGKLSVPHLLPYSASKFAMVGFSDGLRAELRRDGILVTTVCPGLMRTGSPRNATFKGRHRAEYAWFAISGSLPGLSMSAERAARQIVTACRAGDAHVVLSLAAKVGDTAHALFPGSTADLLGLVNRLLPGPGGIGTRAARGADSESRLAPSLLTALGDEAARRNNQVRRVRAAPRRSDKGAPRPGTRGLIIGPTTGDSDVQVTSGPSSL